VLFFVLFFSIFIPRWILTRLTTASLVSGEISYPTLVVGTSDDAEAMSRRIAVLQGSRGFRIVGYVNAGSHHISPVGVKSYTMDDIVDVCAENNVENIILIPEESDSDADSRNHLLEMVNRLFPLECAIYISPSTAHFLTSRVRQTDITSEPLIDISRSDMSDSTVNMKRVSDVAVSAVVLLLISPLLAILGLMVKMDSPGPAFYRQQRVGRHKKVFYINKLRTMRIDAESSGPSLSSENDPRVTRLGRVLRKYRLDELPQFWNVLKGDMSLVGPRPEREYFLSRIVAKAPYYVLLLQVRPGITSWGMVKYGYAENVDEMIERSRYDLLYLENISFTVDMKILFHTVHTVSVSYKQL
ncbi:MAG: exopolysaccharide biosynthesis polyprenyl glycosylphosphotransferase, partial [Paramuribaculum sp.]|nr:exopolysaccharide biosynthesis polyprenyl glycosylphosphotransferase [Paramuribaculum sp.]